MWLTAEEKKDQIFNADSIFISFFATKKKNNYGHILYTLWFFFQKHWGYKIPVILCVSVSSLVLQYSQTTYFSYMSALFLE